MALTHSAEQLFINACWKDPARFDQASSPWCTPNAVKTWPQSVCHVSSQNPVGMWLRMGVKKGHAPDPQISSICILSEFSYVPFLYCLKIAQVRNLFRPINLSFEKKSITKIDWLNSYSWLPSSTQWTLVAAGVGCNPRTDGSLGLSPSGVGRVGTQDLERNAAQDREFVLGKPATPFLLVQS